jgi:mRNA-degrading endonuclease RelE of RelBE toxin-antitoxin system
VLGHVIRKLESLGYKDQWRFRIGDWRATYIVDARIYTLVNKDAHSRSRRFAKSSTART